MIFVGFAIYKLLIFKGENKEFATREWFLKSLKEKGILTLFKIFEHDLKPLEVLIKDDELFSDFSKALEKYKKRKLKLKFEDDDNEDEVKKDFTKISLDYLEKVRKQEEKEKRKK